MDITGPQYFVALAQAGSITGAARLLGVSQPAISNWLSKIEAQLGTPLVIRSKRQLLLTPAGRIYLDGAKKMIEVHNETFRAISNLSGTQSTVIRLSGTPNGGANVFSRLFQAFQSKYPTISLQFIEAYNRQSVEMVENGTVDFAIASSLYMDRPGLNYLVNGQGELILMVPYGFPTAYDAENVKRGDPLPTADFSALQGLPFIMPDDAMSYTRGLNHYFDSIGYRPNVIFQSGNVQIIYNMVRSGNGIAVLPSRLFSPVDRVSPFSLEPKLINHSVLIYKNDRVLTEAEEYLFTLINGKPKSEWTIHTT